MDPRRNQEQIGLFPSFTPDRRADEIDAIRAAAIRARDEQIAASLRRALSSLGRGLGAIGAALLTWPERRRTYENLRELTDRELADIGLTRGDITRVFEPDFHLAPAKAANSNETTAPAAAPDAA